MPALAAKADDATGVASSRMSYSRFLEYLEMGRVKKVRVVRKKEGTKTVYVGRSFGGVWGRLGSVTERQLSTAAHWLQTRTFGLPACCPVYLHSSALGCFGAY